MKYIILACLFFSSILVFAQTTPPQWFESQYHDALLFCKTNRTQIEAGLNKSNLQVAEAMAVVFPEMLRYVLWRDILETKALELLYVEGGSKIADFSIGWFQMKPSFAALIEQKISEDSLLRGQYKELSQYYCNHQETEEQRQYRIERLKKLDWQVQYLSAFISLTVKHLNLEKSKAQERVIYLAAAYNRGFCKSKNELDDFIKLKTFPYGPGRENPFGYSEIAAYFFFNNASSIFNSKTKYQ